MLWAPREWNWSERLTPAVVVSKRVSNAKGKINNLMTTKRLAMSFCGLMRYFKLYIVVAVSNE